MNRRSFFKGLMAVALATPVARLFPEQVAGVQFFRSASVANELAVVTRKAYSFHLYNKIYESSPLIEALLKEKS